MTNDEAIGRTVREYKEKKERATALKSELRRSGDALMAFGQALQQRPGHIQLGQGGFSIEKLGTIIHPPEAQHCNLDRLGTLLGELRRLEGELENLRREVQNFGLSVD